LFQLVSRAEQESIMSCRTKLLERTIRDSFSIPD
jgi:hypothetical protein